MVTAFYVSKPRRHLLLGGCVVISLGVFFLLVENFFGYLSYGRIWPGLIFAYGLGQLVAAFLNRSLRRHALGAVVLIAGGSILFYFTFTRWESLNYSSMMLIIGTSLVILGLKLVIDYFVEGREKA